MLQMGCLSTDHPSLIQNRCNKPLPYLTNLSSSYKTVSSTTNHLQRLHLLESRESQRGHKVLPARSQNRQTSQKIPNFPIHLHFLIACARPPVFSISSPPVRTLITPCVRNVHKPYFQPCSGNWTKQRRKEMVISHTKRNSGEKRNGKIKGRQRKMPKRKSKS